MRIINAKDYQDMSRKAANIISAEVISNPNCVLGLATGSSPIGTYKQLIEWYNKGDIDFSHVTSINLDEYVGLAVTNDQSYRYFMDNNLFNNVNINKSKTNVPNGLSSNPEQECKRYDDLIDSLGGIDIQLLGIGHNGHIGFNEPDDAFSVGTHIVELNQMTRDANARFFNSIDDVPTHAITMGIKAIMQAKKVLLIAGDDKKEILQKSFFGPITPQVPASILQLHPNMTIVTTCDLSK